MIVPRFIQGWDSRPCAGRRVFAPRAACPALLPLPLLDTISEAQILQAVAALLCFALVAAGVLGFSHWRQLRQTRRVLAGTHALAERQGAILATAPAGYWAWPASVSHNTGIEGVGGGTLTQMFTVAEGAFTRFSDVTALLLPTHAADHGRSGRRRGQYRRRVFLAG